MRLRQTDLPLPTKKEADKEGIVSKAAAGLVMLSVPTKYIQLSLYHTSHDLERLLKHLFTLYLLDYTKPYSCGQNEAAYFYSQAIEDSLIVEEDDDESQ
jgi:hypothetical protein